MAFNLYPAMNIQQPNLSQAAAAGQNYRANELALRAQQGEAQRQQALQGALPGAFAGQSQDLATVQALDPELAVKLSDEARNKMREMNTATLGMVSGILNAPPEQRAQVYQNALQTARRMPWLQGVAQNFPDQYSPQVEQQLQFQRQALMEENQRLGYAKLEQEPADVRSARAFSEEPELLAPQLMLRRAGATQVNVGKEAQLPTRAELMRQDVLSSAEGARERISKIREAGREASDDIGQYNRALDLLDKVYIGSLSEQKLALSRLARVLGVPVDTDKIANTEEVQALFGDAVMSRVQDTKGAVSNKEMELFSSYGPELTKTSQGNRQILEWRKAKAKRDRTMARMASRLQKEGATSVEIENALDNYLYENDLSRMLVPEDLKEPAPIYRSRRTGAITAPPGSTPGTSQLSIDDIADMYK